MMTCFQNPGLKFAGPTEKNYPAVYVHPVSMVTESACWKPCCGLVEQLALHGQRREQPRITSSSSCDETISLSPGTMQIWATEWNHKILFQANRKIQWWACRQQPSRSNNRWRVDYSHCLGEQTHEDFMLEFHLKLLHQNNSYSSTHFQFNLLCRILCTLKLWLWHTHNLSI